MTEQNPNLPVPRQNSKEDAERALDGIPWLNRAAILLMSVGEADAAEVLKHLGPKEVQRVGTARSGLSSS